MVVGGVAMVGQKKINTNNMKYFINRFKKLHQNKNNIITHFLTLLLGGIYIIIKKTRLSLLLASVCAFIIDNISHAAFENNFKQAIDLSVEKPIDTFLFISTHC